MAEAVELRTQIEQLTQAALTETTQRQTSTCAVMQPIIMPRSAARKLTEETSKKRENNRSSGMKTCVMSDDREAALSICFSHLRVREKRTKVVELQTPRRIRAVEIFRKRT
eukprot:2117272-Amphidinium_carterae.1